MTKEPHLKMTMKVSLLLAILNTLTTLVDEAQVWASNKGIEIKVVDPGHVAMMRIRIADGSKITARYTGTGENSWGMDIDTLKNFLMNK